jgi:phosphatidylglycerophosphate synthase
MKPTAPLQNRLVRMPIAATYGRMFISFCHCLVQSKSRQNPSGVKHWKATLAILAALSASLAVAEDFKTINGKIYKDATISRVEADGLILRTKTGISKVYFIELPKDVRERFLPTPAKTVAARRAPERTPIESKGWVATMANPKSFVILFVTGTVIIAGVVFAIVRSRPQ